MYASTIRHRVLRGIISEVGKTFTGLSSRSTFSTETIGESRIARTHFIVDYLVERCGLSREKAAVVSCNLTGIKSPEKPDYVLGYLRERGFKDTDIVKLISRFPRFLFCRVETTLKPKFAFFEELGLSGSALAGVVIRYPRLILNYSLDKLIRPNVEILQRYGVSDAQICANLVQEPRFFAQNPDGKKKLATRLEDIGFKRGSPNFFYATYVLSSLSITSFQAKIKLLESFGLSEEEIFSAFRRAPLFLLVSGKKIRAIMAFFIDELRYTPSEVILHPTVLMFSLEKRLVPRFGFLKVLESKGLLKNKTRLFTTANMSERLFVKNYVHRYLDEIPDLQQLYHQFKKR